MADEKKGRGCFFYGCLVSLGVFGLVMAALAGVYLYGTRSLAPYPEKFLSLVDSGDFKGAYDMVGDGWKKQMTLEQFTEFEKSMKDALGACQSKTMDGVAVNSNNGVTTARLVFGANFAKGPAKLTFNMEKQGDEWKIQGLNYQSPLVAQKLTCPHCGAINNPGSKFCASCGKALTTESPNPPAPAEEADK